MKRSLLVLVLIAVAAFAATAGAESSHSKGGFSLGFDGKYRHHKPVKVKNFQFSSLPIKCDQGDSSASSNGSLPSMKVKHLKFHGTFRDHGTRTEVHGRYNKQLTKVKGTLRLSGKYSGLTGCDSGAVKWVTN